MCRFIFYASKDQKQINIRKPLMNFANMCKKTNAPDGDKQEDGWGIYYVKNDKEYIFKSTKAIWEDKKLINNFNTTSIFIAHARSASFLKHKNDLEFNQPFVKNNLVFVFNGSLKNVNLPYLIEGKIGSQKILNLIIDINKKENNLKTSIKKAIHLIKKNTEKIFGLNFLILNYKKIFVYSFATVYHSYYQLYFFQNKKILSLSSSPGIYPQIKQQKIPFDLVLEYTI